MLGEFIRRHGMRIAMHPDQFTLINSPDKNVIRRSVAELFYHARLLDMLGLDDTARIQIHVGGVYGEKEKSLNRFIKRYASLDVGIKRRLSIENDEKNYSLSDCLHIHQVTGIPVIFDVFHHSIFNQGEGLNESLRQAESTWGKEVGRLIVDYSSQEEGKRPGAHASSISLPGFKNFLRESFPFDFDLMLEIKDKEKSALKAIHAARCDPRLITSFPD